jgi:alpha-mannosidase
MTLTPEWARRIDNWRRELARQCYRALGTVELEGYTTFDQLTVTEAQGGPFAPMPPGTRWGAKWEYAWFRTEVVVPPEAAGERFVVALEPGGESAVYVNGVAAGAHDRHHREITLATEAVPGTRYQIMIEAYAGHGPRVAGVGPVPPGRETVPEPPPTQACVGTSTYGIWEEDVYQLRMDVETLYGLRNAIDPDALRVAEIDAGLRDFTLIVDFEVEREEFLASVRAARERLRDLLACVNGSTAPTMYMFGHSHIDVAWLWPLAETERKCVRTFATQLALADEYPEYRYLQSQPHLYTMVKTATPTCTSAWSRPCGRGRSSPRGHVGRGRYQRAGGESLIRQFLHGKRFFREELGVDCELLWLPDVFGYSGALPQIMRGCGIRTLPPPRSFGPTTAATPSPTTPLCGRASTVRRCWSTCVATITRAPTRRPSSSGGTSACRRTASPPGSALWLWRRWRRPHA